jgi:CHAT domain-containing protein
LWEVDDEATAELSKRLYANLKAGQPMARALTQAQEFVMLKKPQPFFWAAFQVSGTGK